MPFQYLIIHGAEPPTAWGFRVFVGLRLGCFRLWLIDALGGCDGYSAQAPVLGEVVLDVVTATHCTVGPAVGHCTVSPTALPVPSVCGFANGSGQT